MLKRLAVALSLSTLFLIGSWRDVLRYLGNSRYFFKSTEVLPTAFYALLMNTLLLSALCLAGIALVRQFPRKWVKSLARLAFLLAFVIAIHLCLVQFQDLLLPDWGRRSRASFMFECVTLLVICPLIFRRFGLRPLSIAVKAVLLLLSPLLPILLVQQGWLVANSSIAEQDKPLAPHMVAEKTETPRILWLVFDEMDQHLAFSGRPLGVELPELDRLRGESLYAANAYPPAGETLHSMPALITGHLVSKAKRSLGGELSITFSDQKGAVNWSTQPNVFSRASDLGRNTALVGWYHPYCRLIGNSLTSCYAEGSRSQFGLDVLAPSDQSVLQNMYGQVRKILWDLHLDRRTSVNNDRLNYLQRKSQKSEYLNIFKEAQRRVTDPRFGLVLVHWPTPHPPYIYSRTKNDFSVDDESSYLDNLALVDRTLGELRQDLERAGQWKNTTIIVTSDHWWRVKYWENLNVPAWSKGDAAISGGSEDHRIPFILKLAGHTEAINYEAPFNTVLTHDLILALLRGELSDPQSIFHWLDQHRSIAETPYGLLHTNKDDY